VRAGLYTIQNGRMSPAPGVLIAGAGYGTHIVARNGLDTSIFTIDKSNVALENLRIDGNGANQTPSTLNCVRFTATRCRISNCFVQDAAGYNIVGFPGASQIVIEGNHSYSTSPGKVYPSEGIELQGTTYCSVVGNTVTGVHNNGILLWNSSGDCHHNTVMGNTVRDCRVSGIHLEDGAHDNVVNGNTCDANGWGIWLNNNGPSGAARANSVTGNAITGSRNNGIQVTGGKDAVITGNTVRSNSLHGIWVGRSSGCAVSANATSANSYGGIVFEDTTDSLCQGNVSHDNGRASDAGNYRTGIMLLRSSAQCSGNSVSGNRCFDSQATPTQMYGIALLGATGDNFLSGNVLTGNGSPGNGILMSSAAASTTHSPPLRCLTASVGTSSTGIAHGLPYTPLSVSFIATTDALVWKSAPSTASKVFLQASKPCTVELEVG
jgi:parallel beta-helix repeat protein